MKFIFVVIVCLLFSLAVAAQTAMKHPIDKALDKCLAVKRGTMPRAECYNKAFEAWEADATKSYAKLQKALSGEQKTALEKAQADWERYRDSEFEFISAQYAHKRGSGYIAVRIISRIEIVKPRAILLEERLQAVTDSTADK